MYVEIPDLNLEESIVCPKCDAKYYKNAKTKDEWCKHCNYGFVITPSEFGVKLLNFLDKYYVRK